MAIETLRSLAWRCSPCPPLGVYPPYRRKRWFRWYVTYQLEYLIWRVRKLIWQYQTGGKQDRFW